MMSDINFLKCTFCIVLSDANSLHRISIQSCNINLSVFVVETLCSPWNFNICNGRRAIDDMFQPVREQALEDAKYEKWEKEALANKDIMPEAPEMELWKDLQPKQTTNAAS